MGNNKKVTCRICLRIMTIDNIHRHMKQHVKRNENRNEAHPTSKRKHDEDYNQSAAKRQCNEIDDEEKNEVVETLDVWKI